LLWRLAQAAGMGALLGLLALPVVALFVRIDLAALVARLNDPAVVDALRLSLATSAAALVIVVVAGTPAAWLLATRNFPGKRVIEVLVDLPMVLPPTVAGFALLMAFGRAGLIGKAVSAFGYSLPFTTAAVVVAQAFMAAPFFVGAARAAFAGVDRRYVEAASTLRGSEWTRFSRIVVPLVMPSLIAGAAMSWARALGEFGATITFAGNLPGVTQTLPLAVYVALQSDLHAALAMSVVLVVVSFTVLFALRSLPRTPAGGLGAPGGRPQTTG
jgi:molybdate transport system permease protein